MTYLINIWGRVQSLSQSCESRGAGKGEKRWIRLGCWSWAWRDMESSERNFWGGLVPWWSVKEGTQGASAIWLEHLGEVMSETGRDFLGGKSGALLRCLLRNVRLEMTPPSGWQVGRDVCFWSGKPPGCASRAGPAHLFSLL